MRTKPRASTNSRLFGGVVVAVWLCVSGSAWAGDGANLQAIQAIIGPPDGSDGLCKILNMNPCPQLPTVTQALLEAAGIELSPPEMVAAQNGIPSGTNLFAGNPAYQYPPPRGPFPFPFPLNATSSPTLSDTLSTLTPLAFVSSSKTPLELIGSKETDLTTAAVTQLYDPDADTFLYGVTVSLVGKIHAPGGTVPDTLLLFYDDLERTNRKFPSGQTVAKFRLPLTVLNMDGRTERAVPATLQFKAPITDCSASKVVGDFNGSGTLQTVNATDIALRCTVVFGPSPSSKEPHAIFEVAIPLLVTGGCVNPQISCLFPPPIPLNTDPAYFYSFLNQDPVKQKPSPSPINMGLYTAFALFDDYGLPNPAVNPPILGTNGFAIGLAPSAGPLGPAPTCTGANCTPPPSTFALCASLPQNGNRHALVPAVGAYYAIATDGETLLSAALPGVSTSVCPRL
jgi:hypothetical protein